MRTWLSERIKILHDRIDSRNPSHRLRNRDAIDHRSHETSDAIVHSSHETSDAADHRSHTQQVMQSIIVQQEQLAKPVPQNQRRDERGLIGHVFECYCELSQRVHRKTRHWVRLI